MTIFGAGLFWHLKILSGEKSKISGSKNCVGYFYIKLFLRCGCGGCEKNSIEFWDCEEYCIFVVCFIFKFKNRGVENFFIAMNL